MKYESLRTGKSQISSTGKGHLWSKSVVFHCDVTFFRGYHRISAIKWVPLDGQSPWSARRGLSVWYDTRQCHPKFPNHDSHFCLWININDGLGNYSSKIFIQLIQFSCHPWITKFLLMNWGGLPFILWWSIAKLGHPDMSVDSTGGSTDGATEKPWCRFLQVGFALCRSLAKFGASCRGYPLVNCHNYGKSPFLLGKSSISMAMFNSKLLVYRRVLCDIPRMRIP